METRDLPVAELRWPGGDAALSPATFAALLPRAERVLRAELADQVAALTARMTRFLTLDLARVEGYYDELARDLKRRVARLVDQGTRVLFLAALDQTAAPVYDRDLGQQLADVGAHVGAMTPGHLATFVAEAIG